MNVYGPDGPDNYRTLSVHVIENLILLEEKQLKIKIRKNGRLMMLVVVGPGVVWISSLARLVL
jgi:hypothetical protein